MVITERQRIVPGEPWMDGIQMCTGGDTTEEESISAFRRSVKAWLRENKVKGQTAKAAKKTLKNLKKLLKNPLTKRKVCGIIYRLSWRRHRNRINNAWKAELQKTFWKKLQKLLKNPLTNGKKCGIIYKLSTRTGTSESIIENWTARACVFRNT